MHYIRFLKPPRLLPSTPPAVSAKITVTTDLGESFLWADVVLVVELLDEDGIVMGKGREYVWKGRDGMRSLEVCIPLDTIKKRSREHLVRMLIRPKEEKYVMDLFDDILSVRNTSEEEDQGGIVTVRSMPISTNRSVTSQNTGLAERVFGTGSKTIHIWEETGESIARHIWDAGLILSVYISTLSPVTPNAPTHLPTLPILTQTLSTPKLNVLELGAGCGIVGITLHTFFPTAKIHLTDLPEATEITSQNLSLLSPSSSPKSQSKSSSSSLSQNGGRITHSTLNWHHPLPPTIATQTFHLILIADCTYNPDVVPDLVTTLQRIAKTSPRVLVLVAMKVRHESEGIFFDLMRTAEFGVVEEGRIGVPVLGGQGEEVLVYGFRLVKGDGIEKC